MIGYTHRMGMMETIAMVYCTTRGLSEEFIPPVSPVFIIESRLVVWVR